MAVVLTCVASLTSCGDERHSDDAGRDPVVSEGIALLQQVGRSEAALGKDLWEVVICRIPADHDEKMYDVEAMRLTESAAWVIEQLEPVGDYFRRWSRDRYSVEFVPASIDVAPDFGDPARCVEVAVAQSRPEADGVLVVADAQHDVGVGGGWGTDGAPCLEPCSFQESRRVIYVGAADFVTVGSIPLDLLEHELGHALGWPHSRWHRDYDSVVDVMGASASGRSADPARVHGPGILAVNRYLSGWLERDPILFDADRIDADRATSLTIREDEFALIFLSPTRALSIEVIADVGDNDHVHGSGVAVHLIDWGASVCANPEIVLEGTMPVCRGWSRSHRLIAGDDMVDGLLRTGDRVDIAGLEIAIGGMQIPTDDSVSADGRRTQGAVDVQITRR